MLPYFPFDDDTYHMKMGVSALDSESLIEVDEHYLAELGLKQQILSDDYRYYFQAIRGSEPLQWEVVELLLPVMARHYPQHFSLVTDGARWMWCNHMLGTRTIFRLGVADSLPLPPLDWVGRQVQEDLLLMAGDTEGAPLVAGQLCFAGGWCLDDMLGRSFLDVHARVPLFAKMIGRPADLLMQRLKPWRPVSRVNWSFTTTDQLNLAPRFAAAIAPTRQGITAENAGERVFLRLERQTLSRLPKTDGILFTIHTYRAPVAVVAADPLRARRLASVVRSLPAETRSYKQMDAYLDPLVAYLEHNATPSPARAEEEAKELNSSLA